VLIQLTELKNAKPYPQRRRLGMRSVAAKEPVTFTMIPVQRNGTCDQQLLIDEH
jgi:hypothetical protein